MKALKAHYQSSQGPLTIGLAKVGAKGLIPGYKIEVWGLLIIIINSKIFDDY